MILRALDQLFARRQDAIAEARQRRLIKRSWQDQGNLERQSFASQAAPDLDQSIESLEQASHS
jgi:hypothetical protein